MRLLGVLVLFFCISSFLGFTSRPEEKTTIKLTSESSIWDSMIFIKARFIKVTSPAYEGYFCLNERDQFQILQYRGGIPIESLKRYIEIEYSSNPNRFFLNGIYYIKAKRLLFKSYYKDVATSKLPFRDWYTKDPELSNHRTLNLFY